jgi:N-acetylneuraminic acid mutarotase
LPDYRQSHASVIANGYVYVLGGANYTNNAQSTVYYAKLNADGSPGAWSTNANALPTINRNLSSVVANGYIYTIGGSNGGSPYYSTVYYAKLNADGSTGAWSTNANALPTGLRDHTSVVANGYVYVLGGDNFSTVYYAKLNADGSTGAWSTNVNTLPATRYLHSSVIANGYVYVIGGWGASTVYYAKLNADGSTGAWSTNVNALPAVRAAHSSIVANGCVYVIGGYDNVGNAQFTVYYAKLNADGSTGAWSTNSNALPATRKFQTSVVSNGYIYAIGGQVLSEAQSTVYYASTSRIQMGGSLDLVGLNDGNLSDPGDFSQGSTGGSLTAGNTQIVGSLSVQGQSNFAQGMSVLGNFTNTGSALFANSSNSNTAFTVQNSTGSSVFNISTGTIPQLVGNNSFENNLNGWVAKGTATISLTSTSAQYGTTAMQVVTGTVANNGASYSVPLKASTQYSLSIWMSRSTSTTSTINVGYQENGADIDCLTGQTVTTTWANYTCTFTTGATVNGTTNIYIKQSDTTTDTLYVDGASLVQAANPLPFTAGGSNLQIDNLNNIITLNGSNSGALGAWQLNGNAITAARYGHSSVIANGYVYVIGGSNSGAQSTVYYAKLNADGSTGAWTTNANALPAARYFHSSVVANGYVYVVGGGNTSDIAQSTVYYAKLNADGSTGAWATNANALPAARYIHSSVVVNGYVYVIGGNNASDITQSTVYYAKLNADGSTGAWSTNANALLINLSGPSSVVANGYVYVIGGSNGAFVSTVYYAKLNADGSTGSWSTNANALPAGRYGPSSVIANGYVYVLGGSNSGAQSTIYYAKLNADGSTGAWATNALPGVRAYHTSVVANGYVYVIGGDGAGWTSQSTVYYASTSRIQMGGSLDLVGPNDGNLSDPGDSSSGSTGGSLTAGNTQIVGSLSVQGQSNFSQSVAVIGNFTNTGSAVFVDSTNSTTAFQIQNSSGTSIFTTNTSGTTITAAANLTTNGRITTGNKSGSTTVAAGAAVSCSGGSPTVTISGNDTSGTVTIVTATAPCSAGTLATVTFANAYAIAPKVFLTPAETNGSTLKYYSGTSNTTTFTIDTNTAAASATTYKYTYWIVQ